MILYIYSSFFLSLILFLWYIFSSNRYYEYEIVNLAPIIHRGIDGKCKGSFVKANDIGNVNKDWLHRNTLILGYDKANRRGGAEAKFTFEIPQKFINCNKDFTAKLLVEAERTHGGLHSHEGPKKKKAIIEVNGEIIDNFWLIQKMPNGEDFGYRNFGPIYIDKELVTGEKLDILLKIEDQMAWDIDRVIILFAIGKNRLTVVGSMIAGAVISVLIGLVPIILEQYLKK